MANNQQNSKTLVKNTLFLYIRTMFTMVVSLYTSRVILRYLGVVDYGIYNVVGGVVTMFSLISGTLSVSVSRNLTYALGLGDMKQLNKMFSMSINVQLCLIGVIVLLTETIGVWFVNNKLVIPTERMYAANWVLQFSILTFVLQLFSVPFNASIISHEKMGAFAYIGVFEVTLKLIAVFMLALNPFDKLIYYAFLLFVISVTIQAIYWTYCRKNFEECTFHLCYDGAILKDLLGFAGWNFLGSAAGLLKNQGLNIMLNIFFGPAVNAARAVATQVNAAINGFVSNFMTALVPQITKAYAQKNYDYLLSCIYRGTKLSYLLLFFLALPVLIETEAILKIWLVVVPETTVAFVRYIIIFSLADTLSRTSINANNATGDIKQYQIVMGLFNLMILPCAYLGVKLGIDAASTELISIAFMLVSLFPRIYFVKKHIPLSYGIFCYRVLLPVSLVTIVAVFLAYAMHTIYPHTFVGLFLSVLSSFIIAFISIFTIGLTVEERIFVVNAIKSKIHKK